MIQALQQLDSPDARSALLVAAEQILPRPTTDVSTTDRAARQVGMNIIREIEARLARGSRSQVRSDPVALREALSREISAHVLAGVDADTIRARIGARGALAPSLYEILFSPKFETGLRFWGLSKNHVVSAITNCDGVQHFVSFLENRDADAHTSLFTKVSPVKRDYTAIVKCQRLGSALWADEAFRIYHDEVDLIGTKSPLEILVRFLDKFGDMVETTVFNSDGTIARQPDRRKLFHKIIYNIPEGGMLEQKFPNNKVSITRSPTMSEQIENSLSFAVNIRAYLDQLARHGVRAEAPREPAASFTFRQVPATTDY